MRAEVDREGRSCWSRPSCTPTGRDRVQVDRQPLRRARDLLGALRVTVFSPDDLVLVKGGPQSSGEYLDDLLVALHPRHDTTIAEVDRVLKQRNALLKSASATSSSRLGEPRTLPEDVTVTLDVWDAKLASAGEQLVRARTGLVRALEPVIGESYRRLAVGVAHRGRASISMSYRQSWAGTSAGGLRAPGSAIFGGGLLRSDRTGTIWTSLSADWPLATHASQGEQRSLALALRLAGHQLVTERIGSPPMLLLDDVFSELDQVRSEALAELPARRAGGGDHGGRSAARGGLFRPGSGWKMGSCSSDDLEVELGAEVRARTPSGVRIAGPGDQADRARHG